MKASIRCRKRKQERKVTQGEFCLKWKTELKRTWLSTAGRNRMHFGTRQAAEVMHCSNQAIRSDKVRFFGENGPIRRSTRNASCVARLESRVISRSGVNRLRTRAYRCCRVTGRSARNSGSKSWRSRTLVALTINAPSTSA